MPEQEQEIFVAIDRLAVAQREFESVQAKYRAWLPIGDQKVGVVGEYLAQRYLRLKYPGSRVTLSPDPSQSGWDLKVEPVAQAAPVLVQVKTVSSASTTRAFSQVTDPCDAVLLVLLNVKFLAKAMWMITDEAIVAELKRRNQSTICDPAKNGSGVACVNWVKDRVPEETVILVNAPNQHRQENSTDELSR